MTVTLAGGEDTLPAYVDAAAAAEHLRALAAEGIPVAAVARAAGTSYTITRSIANGAQRRTQPHIAAAVLAVTHDHVADDTLVDSTDAWATVNRLAAAGVSKIWMSRQLGQTGRELRMGRYKVPAVTARRVAELGRRFDAGTLDYDTNRPGPRNPPPRVKAPVGPVTRGSVARANHTAHRRGHTPVYDDRDLAIIDLARTLEHRIDTGEWRRHAACAGHPTTLFFPPPGRSPVAAQAKAICAACPVAADCLAANRDEPHGIYGGLTADERKQHR